MSFQSELDQTIIERTFFKKSIQDNDFKKMYHNGGLADVRVISNSESVLQQALKYKLETLGIEDLELAK